MSNGKRMTLRAARQHRKLTQVQLADRAQLDQTAISGIERERVSYPKRETLRKLSQALKMDAYVTHDGLWFEERA